MDGCDVLDDKCRVAIPPRLRPQLEHGLVVTSGPDPSLCVYPLSDFAAMRDHMQAGAFNDRQTRESERFLAAKVQEARLDSQGRVSITGPLARYAGIRPRSDVTIIGALRRVEIWNESRFDEWWEMANSELEETFSDASEAAYPLPDVGELVKVLVPRNLLDRLRAQPDYRADDDAADRFHLERMILQAIEAWLPPESSVSSGSAAV
jgi:MraZ protein